MRGHRVLFASATALLALPACGTQEVGFAPDEVMFISPRTEADQGALMIWFEPTADTFAQEQAGTANLTPYRVSIDGKLLLYGDSASAQPQPEPVSILEGGGFAAGYFASGAHHIALTRAGGGPTIFAGDGEIPWNSFTTLYLYGHRDALQGVWVSAPITPAPDTLHVTVTNMVRVGPRIEVVRCAPGGDCTPVSAPLALAETFDGDYAGAELRTGVELGMRQVASAALPAPPVIPLSPRLDQGLQDGTLKLPTSVVVAPVYGTEEGYLPELSGGFYP
ncbi:MAG TPA: hypothetical protein VIF57_31185 [Polyangia bacterium]